MFNVITLSVAIISLMLSFYNFWQYRRKLTLIYKLVASEDGETYTLTGFFSNPSKAPNSILYYYFLDKGSEVETAKYRKGHFHLRHKYLPSALGPIQKVMQLPPGSSVLFMNILFLENLDQNDRIEVVMKTANYTKIFKIKVKPTF